MKTQQDWIDTIKNSCQSCHALGSQGVRRIPKAWGHFDNSIQAWSTRLQAGQAQVNMLSTLRQLGPEKALALFADWTDRIAAGELPSVKPQRPPKWFGSIAKAAVWAPSAGLATTRTQRFPPMAGS